MKKILKRTVATLLCIVLLLTGTCLLSHAESAESLEVVGRPSVSCKSAILMEASTGMVLYEQNADEALPPASVTKVMTLLLIMEAIEAGKIRYTDTVSASAHACSMGGSQIFLEEGEKMTVEDLLKSVVIASANDAAVALAEFVCGTEGAFVEQMNQKARELGMEHTNFENTNGLDDTAKNHVTSARDIAIMSRELMKYERILHYSSIWMDTIRNGEFGLTNTNRLVRFYKGATGLKTGSTAKAGFCISATAERDGMSLICVIMGADSRDVRNASAAALLDYGFANFTRYEPRNLYEGSIGVTGGVSPQCKVSASDVSMILEKNKIQKINTVIQVPESLSAPVEKGEVIGKVILKIDDKEIGNAAIIAEESVDFIGFWGILWRLVTYMSKY